mmetsp:Transcript_39677/g.65782  ORF Transcript_39677/g.65782 Transcript_39677/m.65782 type:complete len:324 (-) Transcript_39677:55-1026(-)
MIHWSANATWACNPTSIAFVSVPKSGTTSVAALLRHCCHRRNGFQLVIGPGKGPDSLNVLAHGHPDSRAWIEWLGWEKWNAALTFQVVRDPWARMVSIFEMQVALSAADDRLAQMLNDAANDALLMRSSAVMHENAARLHLDAKYASNPDLGGACQLSGSWNNFSFRKRVFHRLMHNKTWLAHSMSMTPVLIPQSLTPDTRATRNASEAGWLAGKKVVDATFRLEDLSLVWPQFMATAQRLCNQNARNENSKLLEKQLAAVHELHLNSAKSHSSKCSNGSLPSFACYYDEPSALLVARSWALEIFEFGYKMPLASSMHGEQCY